MLRQCSWNLGPIVAGKKKSEVGGKNPQPGNLFRFVFVSCVPCVRAGEAKLREGVRGRRASSTLVPRLATFPPAAPPALDFALVCLLKRLVGFNWKSVWKLLNLVGFLSVSLSVLPFVWVLKKTLDASRQVDVIIVGFKGIFVMLLQ